MILGEEGDEQRTGNQIMQILLRCLGSYSYLPRRERNTAIKTSAKRGDFSRNQQKSQLRTRMRLEIPKSTVARAAVAVLGLGFIDAGYSGDWSRIGVISKETEEMLKIGALVVVPFCVFLLLHYFRNEPED